MRKVMDVIRMIRLFFRLVFEMLRNYPHLNKDIENNFLVCKKICQKVVKSAKIQLHTMFAENVPKEKSFLLVANHRCFFDVVFLLATVEETISFVAAKELFHYPVLCRYLRSIGCISLDRYNVDIKKLKSSISCMKQSLKRGNLVLFPEGECSYYDSHMKPFKKGGFLGIPDGQQIILPTYIKVGQMRNIGRWMIPKGNVTVAFGESFTPDSMSMQQRKAGDMAAYARERIIQLQKSVD